VLALEPGNLLQLEEEKDEEGMHGEKEKAFLFF
jgi:hypothetical protein